MYKSYEKQYQQKYTNERLEKDGEWRRLYDVRRRTGSEHKSPEAYIALVGLADQRLLELGQGGGAVLHVLLQVTAQALALLLQMVDLAYM
jgi:hypothetical protein